MGSPMRRIASAGGNRNVVSGRITKSGIESAQRSPINLGGFAEAGAFLEHNFHNIRQSSTTGASSLNSSLSPPTPMSPRGGEMTLVHRETARSSTYPLDGNFNYVLQAGGGFTSMNQNHQSASPPETPQNGMQLQQQLNSGWPLKSDYDERQWAGLCDVPDEPLYTPAQDSFGNVDLHMPQPSYLNSASQPVTPAFGQFNAQFMFGNDSPVYKHESPYSEYSFPEAYPQCVGGMSSVSPQSKQKTFQFSNTTPADFDK